jgi:hypothetical protein
MSDPLPHAATLTKRFEVCLRGHTALPNDEVRSLASYLVEIATEDDLLIRVAVETSDELLITAGQPSGDPEIDAMRQLRTILEPLDPAAQSRVITWLNSRFASDRAKAADDEFKRGTFEPLNV